MALQRRFLITGAYGFIGGRLAQRLMTINQSDLLLVDDLTVKQERPVARTLAACPSIDREDLPARLSGLTEIDAVFHLGACTDTGVTDTAYVDRWNLEYSRMLWRWCAERRVPLVYASSAATYGRGEHGFSDSHEGLERFEPLNLYARSKHVFDVWAVAERVTPPRWYGLKFFNVYGPGEAHKGRMASSVLHGFHEIARGDVMTLFRSHHPEFQDGHQSRDFVFVDDAVDVALFLLDEKAPSGLYNCGTGTARPFLDLARALFHACGKAPRIEWVDTPEKYRPGYQYFTEARIEKLRGAGYTRPFVSLEDGVSRYVDFLAREPETTIPGPGRR